MKRQRICACALAACTAAAGTAFVHAQGRGASEWTTSSFDAQRTGSIRTDPRIAVQTMVKPGEFGPFTFLWKLKLESEPNAAGTLTQPILLDRVIGFRGFKSIAFVGTASETVHAVDIDFGVPLWKYHINYSASAPPVKSSSAECPGGLTAALSRPTVIAPAAAAAGGGGGGGRGGRSGGGVGEPGRGAVTLAVVGQARGAAPGGRGAAAAAPGARGAGAVPGSAAAAAGVTPGALPGAARAGGAGGGGGPFVPGGDAAYVVGTDGYLHALNVQNGWESMAPALFLPANTRASGLLIASGPDGAVAYAATTHGCGSQPDGVFAMDLAAPQKSVTAFHANGATIAGTAGPALGRDGTVYIATGAGTSALSNAIVALEPKTLKLKTSATIADADFRSSPLVFQWKDTEVVAVAGADKLLLFDTGALQRGAIATSAAFGNPSVNAGALASWQDAQGTRWIAVPSARGIVAFKISATGDALALQAGWTSRAIASPLPPLVVNGVLFAASSGTRALPSVLYAMDAATGKELWSSGRAIMSTVRGGLSAGQGNVYVPGADSTLYAFGFAIEK